MKPRETVALLSCVSFLACGCAPGRDRGHELKAWDGSQTAEKPEYAGKAEKPFAAGGRIDIDLGGGDFQIRPSADDRINVTYNADTSVELTTAEGRATLTIKDAPNRFKAIIEVPKTADLIVHLGGGNLVVGAITGNKVIESGAGNTEIVVGEPNDYSSVDASVKAGDLDASAFGGSKSGLLQHFTWTGPGTRTLRADLGAGNLSLRSK